MILLDPTMRRPDTDYTFRPASYWDLPAHSLAALWLSFGAVRPSSRA